MLNLERQRLLDRLWAESPKLFVHGSGTLCIDHTGRDGQEEAWPLSPQVIQWMTEHLPENAVTLETGCGYSTIAFMICGTRHVAIAPDYQQHGRIVRWCEAQGVSCANLQLLNARSQDVLPGLKLPPLDLVLIDGCHAFPAPFLDWYYAAEKVKQGGYLVIDDCQLVTGRILAEFLLAEKSRWAPEPWLGKTAIFRRITSEPVVEGLEWIDQPYCAERLGVSSPAGLGPRVRRLWTRLFKTGNRGRASP